MQFNLKLIMINLSVFFSLFLGIISTSNAGSPPLTGTCAILSTVNANGFSTYCNAQGSNGCNRVQNTITVLNFDTGTYSVVFTVYKSPDTNSINTNTSNTTGTFTVQADQPLPGFYEVTTNDGKIHILYPVNGGNTFLAMKSVSGQEATSTGICQR